MHDIQRAGHDLGFWRLTVVRPADGVIRDDDGSRSLEVQPNTRKGDMLVAKRSHKALMCLLVPSRLLKAKKSFLCSRDGRDLNLASIALREVAEVTLHVQTVCWNSRKGDFS